MLVVEVGVFLSSNNDFEPRFELLIEIVKVGVDVVEEGVFWRKTKCDGESSTEGLNETCVGMVLPDLGEVRN